MTFLFDLWRNPEEAAAYHAHNEQRQKERRFFRAGKKAIKALIRATESGELAEQTSSNKESVRQQPYLADILSHNRLQADRLVSDKSLDHVELQLPGRVQDADLVWGAVANRVYPHDFDKRIEGVPYAFLPQQGGSIDKSLPLDVVVGNYGGIQATLVRQWANEGSDTFTMTLYRGVPEEFQKLLNEPQQ